MNNKQCIRLSVIKVTRKYRLFNMKGICVLLFVKIILHATCAQAVSSVVGSTVTLQCPLQSTITFKVTWSRNDLALSYGYSIFPDLPEELRHRLSITFDAGKYHLTISTLVKTDEGQYQCIVGSSVSPLQTLTVIVGPTSVGFDNNNGNKLQGTEGQDLRFKCTAVGGDPKPNVIIQIGTNSYSGTNGVAEHTIPAIDRSYDGTTVTCRTSYHDVVYQPLTEMADIYLYLKPLPPTFSPDPISTEDTKPLELTCTSTGSRPAPTERIWLLGDSNIDITSSSTSMSSSLDPSITNTHIAKSVLTNTVHKQYNGKSITCGFKNVATGNTFVQSSRQIDVKYAPEITVQNKTFQQSETNRELQCTLNGNPAIYTFMKWQHISKYGQLIRSLNSAQTQTLPIVSENIGYQDTGEYVCIASNGIVNSQGQVYQNGSGYVISNAPPFFLNGSFQTVLGQTRSDVTIDVSVYSVPKFTGLTWYKNVSPISPSNKYVMSNPDDIITTTFHGVSVQVDGYRLTLTIRNLQENDFTNYTVKIFNGVGGQVEHLVVLLSESPPDTPTDFNITSVVGESVTIEWKPAFDGGHQQSFVVQYRVSGSAAWQNRSVPSIIASDKDGYQRFTLDNLIGLTSYELRMVAVNKYNPSFPTEILETVTGKPDGNQLAALTVVVIAAKSGILLAFIIPVAIGVRIVLIRKKDKH